MFRPLVAAASLLEALAAAAFATAAFSDPMQRLPITFSAPSSELDVFNRVTSLDWSSDRGMLIAAIVFFIAGLATFIVAARSQSNQVAVREGGES